MKFNKARVIGLVLYILGVIHTALSWYDLFNAMVGGFMVLAGTVIILSDKCLKIEKRMKKIEDAIIKEESE